MFIIDLKVILFVQVIVVVGLPLLLWGPLRLGRLFPLPIVQIFAGILLGPSILGIIAPEAFQFLFKKDVLAGVETLANVALVLFVFLAGCELDRQVLAQAGGMVLKVGVTGVLLPWALGTAAAYTMLRWLLEPGIMGQLGDPTLYAIAFGLCMAVTALPVLVIILRELGFNQKPIGTIALGIGGVDDALLWSSLTVLLPFAAGGQSPLAACLVAVAGGVATIAVLAYVVAPFLERLIKNDAPERLIISLAILVLFVAAAVNEATQLHAAIGAFLTGLLLPDKLRHLCQDRFDAPVTLLLLPFLFLATGLKTSFSFADGTVWLIALVAMVVCVGGKFVGVSLPAYASGESFAFSTTLGVLMQCKGLMEIVVVTILYQKGVFGQVTFSALVLVALISTAMTVPLARLCRTVFGEAATEAAARRRAAAAPAGPAPAPAPAAVPAGPRLDFGEGIGVIAVAKSEVSIGRHSESDIRVNDVRVSRHHATLKLVPDGAEIVNATALRSSPNPILVNGVEKEHALLKDGDTVSLGGVTFVLRMG